MWDIRDIRDTVLVTRYRIGRACPTCPTCPTCRHGHVAPPGIGQLAPEVAPGLLALDPALGGTDPVGPQQLGQAPGRERCPIPLRPGRVLELVETGEHLRGGEMRPVPEHLLDVGQEPD